MGGSEKTRHKLSRKLLQWHHKGTLHSSSNKVGNIFQESSLETLYSEVFSGNWSFRHPLPSTPEFQNSISKDMLCINHRVCTNSLGTASHTYQRMVGTLLIPSSQTSDKGQSDKQACHRKAHLVLVCQLFSAQTSGFPAGILLLGRGIVNWLFKIISYGNSRNLILTLP